MDILISFSSICLLLVFGKILRLKVRLFQRSFIPASVLAGISGLIILQFLPPGLGSACTAGWGRLPGFLINIVFAALFLGVSIPRFSTIWKVSGPQLVYGQIVAWGQYVVGIGIAIVILRPLFSIPSFFGTIIPVGFEGGHGTAAGLESTFVQLGWPQGTDYALASATVGIISAIVVGTALINWAVRKNITSEIKAIDLKDPDTLTGIFQKNKRPIAGYQTVSENSMESLALHLALIGVAIFIGFGLKQMLLGIERVFPILAKGKILQAFPVFPLCMIGGLILQYFLSRIVKLNIIDRQLVQRLSGTALDFLVVSAISMISLPVIQKAIVPFGLVVTAGIIWNVFCVMWLAKRLLPDAWFERAIAEMGQSMGVTATGILLLRIVDPKAKTKALSSFGYKQLLHEPFMGGGLWTSIAIPLAIVYGAHIVFFISVAAICIWFGIWAVFFRKT